MSGVVLLHSLGEAAAAAAGWLVALLGRLAGRWCDHPGEVVLADLTAGALAQGDGDEPRIRWCTRCGSVNRTGEWERPGEPWRRSSFPWTRQPVR